MGNVYQEGQGVGGAVGGFLKLVPIVVLRPVIHISAATKLALNGVRNKILPQARREDSEKYRSECRKDGD